MAAQVIRTGIFNIQVCAPKDWTDAQIEKFAEQQQPNEIGYAWTICGALPNGDPKEVQCDKFPDHKHVVLEV